MAKKLKIPKRVAGVKIPKAIRKGPVADFMKSRAGQLVIAEALVAAGGVSLAAKADEHLHGDTSSKQPIEGAKRLARDGSEVSGDHVQRVTFALKEAARAFREAMEQGPPPQEPWQSAAPEVEAGNRKHSSSREAITTPH